MKIAIMQPYFMPYIGYLSLLKQTDRFVLLDTVQFIRHGWIERNRILKQNDGWQYIQVPLKKFHQGTSINDVHINNSIDWKNKIFAQLKHYQKTAPYYYNTIASLQSIFEANYTDIVSINKKGLEVICENLGLNKRIDVFSQMDLQIEPVNSPDEWALNICKAIEGITEYWNPIGGKSFFDISKYDKSNINLKFHSINLTEYSQKKIFFESGLSIIDVMMFCSAEEINHMLDNYELWNY